MQATEAIHLAEGKKYPDVMMLFVVLQRSRARWQEISDPSKTLSSIIVFFNTFLKLHVDNRIIVVSRKIIFDSSIASLESFVKDLRHEEDAPLSTDLGYALCLANIYGCASRVLIVSFRADKDLLRCAFGAQKLGVRIDSLNFDENEVAKQAALMTGGMYWKGEPLSRFFMWILGTRCESQPISFQASCTCHNRAISLGLVCPICLAIYCGVVPICRKCKIKFEFR
eukprot:jgi/Antlo1/895/1306